MHHLKKAVMVPCSAARMFELVADVERYREFLPWCTGSRILAQQDGEVVAEIHVGHGGASTSFATRNRNQPYELIEMELVDGPFKALEGSWHFEGLPDGGCRATLELDFDFAGHILGTLFDLVFREAMQHMVFAFREQCVGLTLPSASSQR
jgi:ribosome-associated toxin RatA of RatAB toxin-antitoxin module